MAVVARVMLKDEEWVHSSMHYVQRQVSRDRDWKKYVDETSATYEIANKPAIRGIEILGVARSL